MKRETALFEPWGLGDLAISLGIARNAFENGIASTVFCDPRYVEWVKTLPFVAEVRGISVPWTRKKKKYALNTYPWREWRALRSAIRARPFDSVIEPRRDPRAATLLRFLGLAKLIRPASKPAGLGYHRLHLVASSNPAPPQSRQPEFSVVCFFGAEWANRRVPPDTAELLLESLKKLSIRIGVIIPPDQASEEFYARLRRGGYEMIEGPVEWVAKRVATYGACVSTDSGWLHVAHLLGLPTLGLFGFQNDREWMPPDGLALRSEHCLPADARYAQACADLKPLGTLRIDAFENAFKNLRL